MKLLMCKIQILFEKSNSVLFLNIEGAGSANSVTAEIKFPKKKTTVHLIS